MSQRILMLNIGLVVLLAFGVGKLRRDWNAFGPAHNIADIQPAPQVFPSLSVASGSTVAQSDWTEIPSKDPFSFDRNDVDIVIAEAPPKPVGPKPLLFGVMVIGKEKTAFVAPAGNRISRPMKVGEEIDGWTIADIASKSIEVETGGQKQTVILNDPAALVPREAGRTSVAVAPSMSVVGAAPVTQPQVAPPRTWKHHPSRKT